jgi:hypothetical protein
MPPDLSLELMTRLERAAGWVSEHYGLSYPIPLSRRLRANDKLMATGVGREFLYCLYDELDGERIGREYPIMQGLERLHL